MRIRITETGIRDLQDGKNFYDRQEPGVGDYFQDCLFSDIDSLVLYAGIHRRILDITGCSQSGFLTLFITGSMAIS